MAAAPPAGGGTSLGSRTEPGTGRAAAPDRPVGAHVPVAGGLATAGLRYASRIGAEAIQVFVSNPRGWALAAGDPAEDAALARSGLPIFVHGSYLVNLGSPDELTAARSVESVRHALRRGGQIGARGVVVHAGSAVTGERAAALRRTRDRLLPLLDEIPDQGPRLLLESMAGRGQMLCAAVADFAEYLDTLGRHPRAGVCLDTCHVYAAGHDLTQAGGVDQVLKEIESAAGPGRLGLVHANDSKDPCGSRRDRHEHIGAGHIGTEPFRALLRHPATAGVPFVVETPGPAGSHAGDIAALKELRDSRP